MRVIMIPDLLPATDEMHGVAHKVAGDLFEAARHLEDLQFPAVLAG